MAETSNYQLNQWEKTDRIQMEDFNADNLKTDQALAKQRDELVALTAAVALCGNCGIEQFSYVGKGTTGSANPTRLTFSKPPVVFFVRGRRALGLGSKSCSGITVTVYDPVIHGAAIGECKLTWSGNTAALVSSDVDFQLNTKDETYHVFALFAKDQ